MKSLEIVNNTIVKQQTIEIKGTDRLPSIFVDDIRIAGVKWNDSPNVGYITAKLNIHSRVISMENLETIKQDLEVLEIIRKIFGKANFHFYPDGYEADILLEDNDICIEAVDRITKLKVADVKKLKQWLEEHEHDNKSL